jgi:hypothetical protein
MPAPLEPASAGVGAPSAAAASASGAVTATAPPLGRGVVSESISKCQ